MSSKRDALDEWLWGHKGKRRYRTRSDARKRAVYLALRKGHWGLHAYPCQWIGRFEDGKGERVHWHLGHWPKSRRTLRKRLWYWRHRIFIWPFFRARARYRKWRKAQRAS